MFSLYKIYNESCLFYKTFLFCLDYIVRFMYNVNLSWVLQGFVAPSFDDRMLEVVAVLGASQMGMSKVFGGMQHHRISQVFIYSGML